MTVFSREMRLVILMSRLPMAPGALRLASDLAGEGIDWERFFALARIGEVEPAVMTNLLDRFREMLPSTAMIAALERRRETKALSLSRTLVLFELVKLLKSRSVDVMVLKGPVTALYAFGHPALRTFSDLDLFIKPEHLRIIEDLLKERGYKPLFSDEKRAGLISQGHALEYSDGRVKIELHCSLFPKHLRFNLTEGEVWHDLTEITFDGAPLPAPSKAMTFLLACGHAAKHEWSSVRLIADAAQLLDALTISEAAEVLRLAKEARAVGLVALAVKLVREVFDEAHDPFSVLRLKGYPTSERLTDKVIRRMSGQSTTHIDQWVNSISPWLGPLLFWVRARESVVDRCLCLLQPGVRRASRILSRR